MNIPMRLKEIINTEGYTQTAIARKLGMNPKTFSAMLNGRKLILGSHIPKLCEVLKISPNELFDYRSEKTDSPAEDTERAG